MSTYLIIDLSNMFYRARFSVQGDIDSKIGMALSITFNCVKKAYKDFDGKHVVFCNEGKSWRKEYYAPYKKNRSDTKAAMTPKDAEEDVLFWEAYNTLVTFLTERTNVTVLQHPRLEADDLIAGFIQSRPNDHHTIISTDTDFYQLIAPNVSQYNGISGVHITHDGFFDVNKKPVKDNKTGEIKPPVDPKWILFEKCIRGDTSDNVFSAYPGVRTKSTKNKVGLLDAFSDRNTKGYAWNAIMLTKWASHDGTEHRVLDDYNRNVTLVDLTAQPDDIKAIIKETVESIPIKRNPMIGAHFMKYCGKHQLIRLSEQSNIFADILSQSISEATDEK